MFTGMTDSFNSNLSMTIGSVQTNGVNPFVKRFSSVNIAYDNNITMSLIIVEFAITIYWKKY